MGKNDETDNDLLWAIIKAVALLRLEVSMLDDKVKELLNDADSTAPTKT